MVKRTEQNPEFRTQQVARPRGAVQIKQPQASGNAQATFQPPQLIDTNMKIYEALYDKANKDLDKKAIDEATRKGQQDQFEGKVSINEALKVPNTLYGEAYKKSATNSYVVQTTADMERDLKNLTINNDYNVEQYNKEALKIRQKYAQNIPSELQSGLLQGFDLAARSIRDDITKNEFIRTKTNDTQIKSENLGKDIDELIISSTKGDHARTSQLFERILENTNIYYNIDKIYDASEVASTIDTAMYNIIAGDIEHDYDKVPQQDKEAWILNQIETGFQSYIDEFNNTYKSDIKKIIPNLELPNVLDAEKQSKLGDYLNSKYTDLMNDNEAERKLTTKKFNAKLNSNEQLTEKEIEYARSIGFSEEAIQLFEFDSNIVKEANRYVGTVNTIPQITERITSIVKMLDDMTDEDGNYDETSENQIKFLALQNAYNRLVVKNDELKTHLSAENLDNIWEINGINRNDLIQLAAESDDPVAYLQKEVIKLAQKYGLDDLPFAGFPVDLSTLSEQLKSPDAKVREQAIATIQQLELDMDISLATELDLQDLSGSMIIALNTTLDTAASQKIIKAELQADQMNTLYKAKKDAGQIGTLNDKPIEQYIMQKNEFKKYTMGSGMSEAATLDFFVKIMKQEIAEFDKSPQEAFDFAVSMYDSAFATVSLGEDLPAIQIPKRLATADQINAANEFWSNFANNPIAYDYVCEDTPMSISECVENLQKSTELRIKGSMIYMVQTPKDNMGTSGMQVFVGHTPKGEFQAQTPVIFDLSTGKRIAVDNNKPPHPVFTETAVIPNKQLEKADYIAIGQQITKDAFVNHIAESSEFFNFNLTSVLEEAYMINGIVQKNVQRPNGFTQEEFDMLSNYNDFDDMDDPDVQKYINDNWSKIVEQGGINGKVTGARFSPVRSLYVLYLEALDNVE